MKKSDFVQLCIAEIIFCYNNIITWYFIATIYLIATIEIYFNFRVHICNTLVAVLRSFFYMKSININGKYNFLLKFFFSFLLISSLILFTDKHKGPLSEEYDSKSY